MLFAVAAAERPPAELTGRADEIRVTLPWGSLLEGVALAHDEVLDGLTALAKPGARLRLVVNGAPWASNAPKRLRGLPQLTPDYVRAELAGRYAAHGIVVDDARRLRADEVDGLHSTWAKRLRHGRGEVELTVVDAHLRNLATAAGAAGTRVAR